VTMETVDGARVYSILDADRPLIRAFMKGVNETASLKFDHPGLVTTAAHEADQLTIQNDLGATQNHVLVIHVEGLFATLMYADIHRSRIRFLQEMLQTYDVQWPRGETAASDEHQMMIGHFTAETPEHLDRYLTFLGSRLVFLIEWNRARKRLTALVGKNDAPAQLKGSGANNCGHRAFRKRGVGQHVEGASGRAFAHEMRPGPRLDKWLGAESARAFLMAALRITASGLIAGHSLSLIEDEI